MEKWADWELGFSWLWSTVVVMQTASGTGEDFFGLTVLEVLVHVHRSCCTGVYAEKIVYIVVARKWVGRGEAGSPFPLQVHTSNNLISSL